MLSLPKASTSGLPVLKSPRGLPDMTTAPNGELRRQDLHLQVQQLVSLRSLLRGLPAGLVAWSKRPAHARAFDHPVPPSGSGTRSPMARPSSRVSPVQTCPALRPRWCPAHAPQRPQDCCLPGRAHRRLPTTLHVSGRHHAAYLLATPGFVRPLTGRPAGSLLTGWLDVHQVGFAHGTHPLGNNNQFHAFSPHSKVSGLPWREHAVVRLGAPSPTTPHASPSTGDFRPHCYFTLIYLSTSFA